MCYPPPVSDTCKCLSNLHLFTQLTGFMTDFLAYFAFPVLEMLCAAEEDRACPLLSGIERTSNVVSRVNFILNEEKI